MRTQIVIDPTARIGKIDPNIYGQYFEHVDPSDHCIYGGLTSDDPKDTNELGLRKDVIERSKELQVPLVRWPGGCFADIYHWEDGIGPKASRPVRRNWFWGGLESNQFGTDEFLQWCQAVGAEPYINVNMGTGTLGEAIRWLDYCNGVEPTTDVLRRAENGHPEPYNVKYWGLGNETWGKHEPGHSDAQTYANKLREWAHFFKKQDRTLKVLGVGEILGRDQDWNSTVVSTAGRLIDYLTVHGYAHTTHLFDPDDYYPTVGTAAYFEDSLAETVRNVHEIADRLGFAKPPLISMDEWNIRHLDRAKDAEGQRGGTFLRRSSPRTFKDAIFAAGVFHAMHRLSPHVAMACYVFLVNGNAVMNTRGSELVTTPLFDVFQVYRRLFSGIALKVEQADPPTFLAPVRPSGFENGYPKSLSAPYVDVSASLSEESGQINIGLINRHKDEAIDVDIVLTKGSPRPVSVWTLYHDDVLAVNDFGKADEVRPVERVIESWNGVWRCPPHSISILQCK